MHILNCKGTDIYLWNGNEVRQKDYRAFFINAIIAEVSRKFDFLTQFTHSKQKLIETSVLKPRILCT